MTENPGSRPAGTPRPMVVGQRTLCSVHMKRFYYPVAVLDERSTRRVSASQRRQGGFAYPGTASRIMR